MTALEAGSCNARYPKKERMAARRILRVRALLPRSFSKCSRKVPMKGESRSSMVREDGCFLRRS